MGFSQNIIEWYERNKRKLPWRETNDPYKIWISEIILQQTRVEQGLSYYENFIGKFPDVGALASADEDTVMKSWQGLGYYSRARHLHQAARAVMTHHDGNIPDSYKDIRSLKGIGEYTAAAIASIAFGEPRPVIDGNVMRVMARFLGIREPVNTTAGRKKVGEALVELIDVDRPGDFNQAVMELGALVCKPRQPACHVCPLNKDCYALRNRKTAELPVVIKNTALKPRFIHYLCIQSHRDGIPVTYIRKREGRDIWSNLYDFPSIEMESKAGAAELRSHPGWLSIFQGLETEGAEEVWTKRHLLSHQELFISFWLVPCEGFSSSSLVEVAINEFDRYPVPKPVELFSKKIMFQPGIFLKKPD